MSLTLDQVRHVAKLARLALSPQEEQRFAGQLSAVLEAIEQLANLDTHEVEATSHASLSAQLLRKDQVKPSLPLEQSLANAPAKVGSSFAVPKILE